ncbi:uncharacterized protein O3C94_016901 [Discoglossus pictus]
MAPSNTETETLQENEMDKQPQEDKEPARGESEKDSGYSDNSSDGLSCEDSSVKVAITPSDITQEATKALYAPIYILQNVVVKQTRLLLLQPPIRRHRKRPSSTSYLPILRSYPRIAPRIAPAPTPPPATSPAPSCTPPMSPSRPPPALLEISLRSIALMHRNRETQRSIRELRAHTRLYNQALQGAEGGWERLRRAMEKSGVYRGCLKPSSDVTSAGEEEENTPMQETPGTSSDEDNPMPETSKPPMMPTETAVMSSRNSMMSSDEAEGDKEKPL